MQQVELLGITRNDIQDVFTKALRDFKQSKTRVIYLDASYLYNFHLDDFEVVRKFNLLGRYDLNAVLEWHNCLERWLSDQTVTLGERVVKPIQIERSFDRVVNEGLEVMAQAVISGESNNFTFRTIGNGTFLQAPEGALPSDQTLSAEINRIDVRKNKEGGSLSRDGSTIYSVGNHAKSVISASVTECGMHSTNSSTTDKMFDHSIFATPVTHVQNSDAVGSTTVIYQCAA